MKYLLIICLICVTSVKAQFETGLQFLDEEEYKSIPLGSVPMMGSLPSTKDLSEWFPIPKYQGKQASCVGWAVAYGLKTYQEAVERRRKPTEDKYCYSPGFIYNQIKLSHCENGSYIKDALNLLKTTGVAKLTDFPYSESNCNAQPTPQVTANASENKIADWRRVNIQDEVEVKSQLHRGFPIVIGMYVDDGFRALGFNQIYKGKQGREHGGHAMVVVGYDDDKQAYKVFNSWGTNWGTNGYGWISYNAFKNRVKCAYTAQDVVINDPDAFDDVSETEDADITVPVPEDVVNLTTSLQQPIITHNQLVQSSMPGGGLVPGMIISVPGTIQHGRNSLVQVVLRFYMPNGQALVANMNEAIYRDAHGLVATGTDREIILSDDAELHHTTFSIPYYALNFMNTGGLAQYQLQAQATLYVNDFEKAQSPSTPMIIRF